MDKEPVGLSSAEVVKGFTDQIETALAAAVVDIKNKYRKSIRNWSIGTIVACGAVTVGINWIMDPPGQAISDMLAHHANGDEEICTVSQEGKSGRVLFICRYPPAVDK